MDAQVSIYLHNINLYINLLKLLLFLSFYSCILGSFSGEESKKLIPCENKESAHANVREICNLAISPWI